MLYRKLFHACSVINMLAGNELLVGTRKQLFVICCPQNLACIACETHNCTVYTNSQITHD